MSSQSLHSNDKKANLTFLSKGKTLHRQKPIKKVLFLQNVAQFLGLIFDKKVYCQKEIKTTFSVYFLASLAF